ncbi:MAG: class I SAM-dependent methyltransferase [Candidatus Margulisiibacteriota bacterium]|jgi:ubiquinone/menaquinone biosynthesis C-methylase UbiE
MKQNKEIKHNVLAHDNIYNEYEQIHSEIYNLLEQDRLHQQLKQAIGYIKTPSTPKEALDYGCGSGNLTKHLLNLGLRVTASDISNNFLALIKEKFGHTGKIKTLKINGQDLSNVENNQYDLVATYSVLHHIPDYLSAIKELVRVTKKGGVIYLDHENNESFWNKSKEYEEFLKLVKVEKNWRRFFKLSKYLNKVKKTINPRYQSEGDIHVFPDNHIEWEKIADLLNNNGCEIVLKKDYLLYIKGYSVDIYQEYKNKCTDMKVLIARKK